MAETSFTSPKLDGFPSQANTTPTGPPLRSSSLGSAPTSSQAISEGRRSAEGEFLNMDDDDDDDDEDDDSDVNDGDDDGAESDSLEQSSVERGQQPAAVHDFPLPPPSFPHAQAQVQAQREAHAQAQQAFLHSHTQVQARASAQQQGFPPLHPAVPSFGNQSFSSPPSQVPSQMSVHARTQAQEPVTAINHQGPLGPSSSGKHDLIPGSSLEAPNPTHTPQIQVQAAQAQARVQGHHQQVPGQQHVSGQGPSGVTAHGSQDISSLSSFDSSGAAFRALPLLASDIPYTTIQVANSSIRPNDRGKEVLSFIVVVDPGHGKAPWKVEKLYSDVLGLDQRIRASVGKGVGKKIANLPEGKLWRDHAPAKVDQRKVGYVLRYFSLPLKH
jgi:RalA-binding protein 1